ncbi:hypothetical protein GOC74_02095 [Halomicrobium mukohataei]|uniref:Uncharacterized protein n=1 Tax=Halomicrobium mukohataei TaxID=57705 RepID=A0A847U6W4_9EURY|nr:hypothetical protein [Halomicrobium mukohataei]NLV08729.1 hypothetical protein [Halomicrobium mukohataei]
MTTYGLIGSDTPVDDLLGEYFPGAPNNLLYEVFEDETNALLAALLMEMRGDDIDQGTSGETEARYYSEPGVVVDEEIEDTVRWDFAASTVVLYGFDEPIVIGMQSPNKANREIPLSPSEAPFSLSQPGGIDTSTVWYRLQEGAASTSLNVLALR